MTPVVKYTLARLGIFVACLLPLLFLPSMSFLLKLMIAFVLSFVLSWVLLRQLQKDVADRMSESAQRRVDERRRLRAALSGDEERPPAEPDKSR